MSPSTPSKHELRTRRTGELLLQAAETVFVRDGYEKADLAEIAELAGRTKGSIYARFQSKEELFFALVERYALKRRAAMGGLLARSGTVEGNLAALREHFLETALDRTWGLLLLEFRLYTIRHPDVRERLLHLYRSIVPADEESAYEAILGIADASGGSVGRSAAVHSAFAMLYGLHVEWKFHPEQFDEGLVRRVAGKVFDALFEAG